MPATAATATDGTFLKTLLDDSVFLAHEHMDERKFHSQTQPSFSEELDIPPFFNLYQDIHDEIGIKTCWEMIENIYTACRRDLHKYSAMYLFFSAVIGTCYFLITLIIDIFIITGPGQVLLSRRGREIFIRVIDRYVSLIEVSCGFWTAQHIEAFQIHQNVDSYFNLDKRMSKGEVVTFFREKFEHVRLFAVSRQGEMYSLVNRFYSQIVQVEVEQLLKACHTDGYVAAYQLDELRMQLALKIPDSRIEDPFVETTMTGDHAMLVVGAEPFLAVCLYQVLAKAGIKVLSDKECKKLKYKKSLGELDNYGAMLRSLIVPRSVLLQIVPSLTYLSVFSNFFSESPLFLWVKRKHFASFPYFGKYISCDEDDEEQTKTLREKMPLFADPQGQYRGLLEMRERLLCRQVSQTNEQENEQPESVTLGECNNKLPLLSVWMKEFSSFRARSYFERHLGMSAKDLDDFRREFGSVVSQRDLDTELERFNRHDTTKSDALTPDEFAALCRVAGEHLSEDELHQAAQASAGTASSDDENGSTLRKISFHFWLHFRFRTRISQQYVDEFKRNVGRLVPSDEVDREALRFRKRQSRFSDEISHSELVKLCSDAKLDLTESEILQRLSNDEPLRVGISLKDWLEMRFREVLAEPLPDPSEPTEFIKAREFARKLMMNGLRIAESCVKRLAPRDESSLPQNEVMDDAQSEEADLAGAAAAELLAEVLSAEALLTVKDSMVEAEQEWQRQREVDLRQWKDEQNRRQLLLDASALVVEGTKAAILAAEAEAAAKLSSEIEEQRLAAKERLQERQRVRTATGGRPRPSTASGLLDDDAAELRPQPLPEPEPVSEPVPVRNLEAEPKPEPESALVSVEAQKQRNEVPPVPNLQQDYREETYEPARVLERIEELGFYVNKSLWWKAFNNLVNFIGVVLLYQSIRGGDRSEEFASAAIFLTMTISMIKTTLELGKVLVQWGKTVGLSNRDIEVLSAALSRFVRLVRSALAQILQFALAFINSMYPTTARRVEKYSHGEEDEDIEVQARQKAGSQAHPEMPSSRNSSTHDKEEQLDAAVLSFRQKLSPRQTTQSSSSVLPVTATEAETELQILKIEGRKI